MSTIAQSTHVHFFNLFFMKKYVFFTAITACLFLTSCTTDDLESKPKMEEIANPAIIVDDLNTPAAPSEPVKTKDKGD